MNRKVDVSAMKPLRKPKLQHSLAGFNCSRQADRTTSENFIASYLRVHPNMKQEVAKQLPDLQPWLVKMLTKPTKTRKSLKPTPKNWVPRNQYIPDKPSPRATFRWESTNIARAMRYKLEQQAHQD